MIAVPALPGIANFDDLDPFSLEPEVQLSLVRSGEPLPAGAALVILPGSKTTIADLAAFRREGWDIDLFAHLRRGGHVLGLCGGYQMLGRIHRRSGGHRGPAGRAQGLACSTSKRISLAIRCCAGARKERPGRCSISGYEMHTGRSFGPDCARPMMHLRRAQRWRGLAQWTGARRYVHGLFADAGQRSALLARLGGEGRASP